MKITLCGGNFRQVIQLISEIEPDVRFHDPLRGSSGGESGFCSRTGYRLIQLAELPQGSQYLRPCRPHQGIVCPHERIQIQDFCSYRVRVFTSNRPK